MNYSMTKKGIGEWAAAIDMLYFMSYDTLEELREFIAKTPEDVEHLTGVRLYENGKAQEAYIVAVAERENASLVIQLHTTNEIVVRVEHCNGEAGEVRIKKERMLDSSNPFKLYEEMAGNSALEPLSDMELNSLAYILGDKVSFLRTQFKIRKAVGLM